MYAYAPQKVGHLCRLLLSPAPLSCFSRADACHGLAVPGPHAKGHWCWVGTYGVVILALSLQAPVARSTQVRAAGGSSMGDGGSSHSRGALVWRGALDLVSRLGGLLLSPPGRCGLGHRSF